MVVTHSDHHVSHALHSAMLSVHQCDDQESQADHDLVCECQSGLDNDHGSHRSKEKTGSKKESIKTITTIRHSSVFVYIRPVQCSICYMCFIATRVMSFNPSSSQSSCLTAVSNSAESSRSQVLHQLSTSSSTSVATFISRMAAAQQTSASAAVNEVAASVAKSIQSMTVAHAKHEELNNDVQAQVVRHALSQMESTQKDHELQRVMDLVTVNTEHSREEHLLKALIKSQMADQPQQWDDHSADLRHFIESFKHYRGDFEMLFKVSQGYDHYYIVLSESEFMSWQTYGWAKSPRVTEEMSDRQSQVFHTLHTFNRLGDAVNHMYYLRVAHSFMFNSHVESGHGRHYICSGTLRGKVQDIPQVSEEVRARILRIVIDQESMSLTDEVELKKVKLHQFFKDHQIWAAQTEESSSFMKSHVLYHESASVSSLSMSESILDIMQNTQVRLTEHILKIIRHAHPHMQNLLFSGGELRSSITELDIDRSFTVVDVHINPWKLKDSNSMEVDESSFKRGKKSSSGSAVLTINSGRLTFG